MSVVTDEKSSLFASLRALNADMSLTYVFPSKVCGQYGSTTCLLRRSVRQSQQTRLFLPQRAGRENETIGNIPVWWVIGESEIDEKASRGKRKQVLRTWWCKIRTQKNYHHDDIKTHNPMSLQCLILVAKGCKCFLCCSWKYAISEFTDIETSPSVTSAIFYATCRISRWKTTISAT